jgi:two-component system, NtrC family, sensor histidine kinase KinB
VDVKTKPENDRQIISLLISMAIGVITGAWLIREGIVRDINADVFVTWIVCAVVYGIADWLSGPLKDGLWSGYLTLVSIVNWLIFGSAAALLMIILTPIVVWGILAKILHRPQFNFWRVVYRIVLNGLPLIFMRILYNALGGTVPVTEATIAPIGLTIVILLGFGLTQVIGLIITYPETHPIWQAGQRHRIIPELLLLLISVPLVLVYNAVAPMVFNLMLGLVAAQAVRHRQFIRSQLALTLRVRELSMLNDVSQHIGSQLDLERIYEGIARWAQALEPEVFMLALYDEDLEGVSLPVVVENGQTHQKPFVRLVTVPEIARVVNRREVIDEVLPYADVMPDATRTDIVRSIGLPLLVGDKLLGVIVLILPQVLDINIRVLDNATRQIALALRNAMLYERSVDVASKLKQINSSIQDVMFNLNRQDALQTVCETARQLLDGDAAALFLLKDDHTGRDYRLVYSVGDVLDVDMLAEQDVRVSTLDPVIISTTALDENSKSDLIDFMKASSFNAMVEVTMKSGTIPMGKLVVFHIKPHIYMTTDIEILETLAYQVAAALDNAELLSALEVYAAEQSQLVHLSRMSTSSLDSSEIAASVAKLLQETVNSSWVAVGLRPVDTNYLQLYRSDDTDKRFALVLDDLPEIYKLSQGDQVMDLPSVFRDDETTSDLTREWMQTQGIKTLVVALLAANGNTLGFIFIADETGEHDYTDSELRLLEMASNQMAMQLHNAQLYQYTQAALDMRLHQLGLIETLAQEITSALSVDQLIRTVLEAAIRATLADQATLGLLTDNDDMRLIALEKQDENWISLEKRQGVESGLMGAVFSSGQSLIVSDNYEHPAYLAHPSGRKYQSSLVVPMIQDNKVIGVINVESLQPNHFDTEHADFAMSLAGHATMSLQNAQLLADRQWQISTLTRLRELALQLAGVPDTPQVMSAILQCAQDILQAQAAALYAVNAQGMIVCLQQLDAEQRLHVPDTLILNAVNSGEIQIVDDVRTSDIFLRFDRAEQVIYNGLMCIPLQQDDTYNVLVTTFSRERPYRATDRAIASLLAIQAASHLQNATLYQRVNAQNDRMRAILDSTRDGIILLDRHGRLIEANPSAENLLGLNLVQYIGKHFVSSVHQALAHYGDESRLQTIQNMLNQVRLESTKIVVNTFEIREGDQIHYVKQVESPVLDSDNNIIGRLLTLRDMTEERQLAVYRDEVSNMVVHDLRGPLGSIVSSLLLIQEELAELTHDGALDTLVQVSLDSANRLVDLVNSLLEIAKLETRRMPLQKKSVSIQKIIDEATATLEMTLQRTNIQLMQELSDVQNILVDNGKIRRVFINLIDNAIRYAPDKGRILIRVEQQANDKLRVLVADDGPGIPIENAAQIFEKFHQVNTYLPRMGDKGSGLGLTFCKLAIEAHDEQIWLEPDGPLPGACFVFTLPLVP